MGGVTAPGWLTGTAIAVLTAAALAGSAQARGGNEGCDQETGTFFADHFFESGDNIVFGWMRESSGKGAAQDEIGVQNTPSAGGSPSTLRCGNEVDGWNLVTSRLGPGDDSVRLNVVGLELKALNPWQPIPRRIEASLLGGGGDDRMRGHAGIDGMNGGGGGDLLKGADGRDTLIGAAGADVIKATDDRRDLVDCGTGRDRAIVDPADTVTRCERVVER